MLPALLPAMSFDEVCTAVVTYLKQELPLGFWSVSQYTGEDQVYLAVQDDAYGKVAGQSHRWSDSFCQHMVTGATPQIAPDAMAVPEYAGAGVAQELTIGAYVGIPITGADGELFGTVCGLDPRAQPAGLADAAPLLQLLSTLLSQALRAERALGQVIAREEALEHRATHDALTGVASRDGYREELARALGRAAVEDVELTVVICDIDGFEAVNDTCGTHAADDLLVQSAQRLRAVVGQDAVVVGRLGSDEFGVVLVGTGTPELVADRIVNAFREPFAVGGGPLVSSLSIGLATAADARVAGAGAVPSMSDLLGAAGVALQAAKRAGGTRWARYTPGMSLPQSDDLHLRAPLAQALAEGRLVAEFQPVVDLGTRRVVGAEALARWQHEGAAVSPATFLPVAARAGLLPELTECMIEQALVRLATWSGTPGLERLTVSVNLSSSLIHDVDLPARVEAALRRHRVGPGRLVLEITEEALLDDAETARAVTRELRDLGTRLALDDFGTGYSSMLHLRSMRFDGMKLDRAFLRDIDTNLDTQHFVKALLRLGLDLDMQVVAEGVERRAQADALRHLGVTRAQGHLFSPAVPAQVMDTMLHHPLGLALPVQRSTAASRSFLPD